MLHVRFRCVVGTKRLCDDVFAVLSGGREVEGGRVVVVIGCKVELREDGGSEHGDPWLVRG